MRKQYGQGWNPYNRGSAPRARMLNARDYKPPVPDPEPTPTCGDAILAWLEAESDKWIRSVFTFEKSWSGVFINTRSNSKTIGTINFYQDHFTLMNSYGLGYKTSHIDYSDPLMFEELEHQLRLLYNTC